ncbi:MAG: SMI1/KNR4 family protein [Polyangiaceae bacterium]|nr:SMI1/KNR4 family protein [Polyangiaceae bacterium]
MSGRLRAELEARGVRLRDPVGNFALLRLIQAAPFPLPAAYLDLLRATNGGSGTLEGQTRGIYLTAAEQVMTEHEGWGVDEHAPDHLLFASDGDGGFFLLDAAGRVRSCPSSEVGSPESWRTIFERFEELVAALGSVG